MTASPSRQRASLIPTGARYKGEDGAKKTLYLGNVEIVTNGGVVTTRRTVAGVMLQTVVGATATNYYLFHDQLGSLVRIAGATGTVVSSMDFQAFGGRRNTDTQAANGTPPALTPRGFTGHEMLDSVSLIHMNGRIFDPYGGRFLQPDPVIQAPDNTQSWNAYTYCFNNPLNATDPTGMMTKYFDQILSLGMAVVYGAITGDLRGAGMVYSAMLAATVGGYMTSYAATGSNSASVRGALTALVTFGIANSGWSAYEQVFAQAVTGGVMESLGDGKFGHGFVAAGLTAAFMPMAGHRNPAIGAVRGALIGGTISAVTGGKFANGAVSGAIQGAMTKSSESEVTGAPTGSGSTGGSYQDMARHAAVHVETMVSSLNQTQNLNSFGESVHERIQALTSDTGYEYKATFSERSATSPITGAKYYIYAAAISTSRSPVVSAAALLTQGDFRYMKGFDMHSHGSFVRGYKVTKLDAAYLAANKIYVVSSGDQITAKTSNVLNNGVDLYNPSELDLRSSSGGFLSTPRGLTSYWPEK